MKYVETTRYWYRGVDTPSVQQRIIESDFEPEGYTYREWGIGCTVQVAYRLAKEGEQIEQ